MSKVSRATIIGPGLVGPKSHQEMMDIRLIFLNLSYCTHTGRMLKLMSNIWLRAHRGQGDEKSV